MIIKVILLSVLLVADNLAFDRIPAATYRKLQGLSTYEFARNHLYRKPHSDDEDTVDGGRHNDQWPVGPPSGGLQSSRPSNPELEGHSNELYPGENLIFTREGSIQSRNVIAQSLVAEPAGCTPLLQPVRLPADLDPMVIYFPSCIMVNRCTGCCSPDSVTCQPTVTTTKNVQVMKARYTGGEQFAYEGTETVAVEEHEACDCQCAVQSTACSPPTWYDAHICACRCTNEHLASSCISPQVWSETQCACTCPRVTCPPGQTQHSSTCRCLAPFIVDPATPDPCVPARKCRTGFKATVTNIGCVCRRVNG